MGLVARRRWRVIWLPPPPGQPNYTARVAHQRPDDPDHCARPIDDRCTAGTGSQAGLDVNPIKIVQ